MADTWLRAHAPLVNPILWAGAGAALLFGLMHLFSKDDLPAPPPPPSPPASSSATATGNNATISPTINVNVGTNAKEMEEQIRAIASQYGGGGVIINGVFDNDPLIYLDLQPASTDWRDRVVCHNRGKSVAHNIQIQPIKLAGRTVTFSSIGSIGPDKEADVNVNVDVESGITRGWLFHWLLEDWRKKAEELVGDWPVPMVVNYNDALNSRKFTGTSTLEFHALKYQYLQQSSPERLKLEKLWDFKNPQFAAEKL